MKKTFIIALKIGLGILALLLMLGNNCITSGNIIVVYEEIPDLVGQTNTSFNPRSVDLTENGDWNEHRDQLNSVDDIGFACKITNHESTVATGQIWISDKNYTTPDAVKASALKILDGIVVPANGTRSIEWKESADFLSNFLEAKKIVYTEKFNLYFMVAETPFDIDVKDIILFLSVNGKP
ncbi:MAG: hypothetical protein E4G91_04110 [Candidatus Zixiibacteriota bacterium]|nr:MAG: hypothetical protein E4G91_04110 [candidate division Zixibacteria bacterium]